jgi:hypothetical protein
VGLQLLYGILQQSGILEGSSDVPLGLLTRDLPCLLQSYAVTWPFCSVLIIPGLSHTCKSAAVAVAKDINLVIPVPSLGYPAAVQGCFSSGFGSGQPTLRLPLVKAVACWLSILETLAGSLAALKQSGPASRPSI